MARAAPSRRLEPCTTPSDSCVRHAGRTFQNGDFMTQPKWTRRHALQAVAAATGGAALPSWSQDSKEAAHDPREIRIGQSAHTTGPLSVTMVPVFKGQELAVDEVNRKGGINGRPVRLITIDDAY